MNSVSEDALKKIKKIAQYMYITNCYGVPTKQSDIDMFIAYFYRQLKDTGLGLYDLSLLDNCWDKIYDDAISKYATPEINYGKLFYEQLSRDTSIRNPKISNIGFKDEDYEKYKIKLREYIINFQLDELSLKKYEEYKEYLDTFNKNKQSTYVVLDSRINYNHNTIKIMLPSFDIICVDINTMVLLNTDIKLKDYLEDLGITPEEFNNSARYIDENNNILELKNLIGEDTNE